MERHSDYRRGFVPYAAAALLIGLVGGFSTVLGPAFVQDLGISYSNTTWTALAQAMSTAACAPVLGKAGDLVGRKLTLLAGMAVFTLGNVLSALAGSLAVMLLARFVVGIGIAAMAPTIMAYIVTEFPPEQVAGGFARYMLLSSASVVAGPALGGVLVAAWGWRAMLWLCAALCAAALAVCAASGERAVLVRGMQQQFDIAGAVLVLLFFSLALCIPSVGQNLGWHTWAFRGVLAGAAVSLLLLWQVERRAAQPILSGGFLRRRAFVLSVLALFLTQGLMQANMTNTIIFVNYTQPDNTAATGYAISVMYLGMSLGAVLLGPLADRFEPKLVLSGSLALTGAGCALLFCFSAETPLALLMASLGLLGFGLGGNGTIFMKVTLAGLPPREAGAGTGAYGLFRDLAAPFGVAVFVPRFTNQITGLLSQGAVEAEAAVQAAHTLATAELLCVAGGLAAVLFLPNMKQGGANG